MKKTLLILLFIAGVSGMASSQLIRIGIKGGLNYSKLAFDDMSNVVSGNTTYSLAQDESFMGYHIGLMSRINIFNLYIQPELLFNTSGGKVLVESTGQTVVEEVKQIKYNKIDLPVMVGFKFGPARINAGPVASYVLSSDSELGEVIDGLDTFSKNATIGFQAGAGLDILKKITLDARYEGGLSKLGDKITVGGEDYTFDSRDSKWVISLGILF